MLSKIKIQARFYHSDSFLLAYLALFDIWARPKYRAYHVVHCFDDMILAHSMRFLLFLHPIWFPYVMTAVYFCFAIRIKRIFPADLQPDDGEWRFSLLLSYLSERSVSPPRWVFSRSNILHDWWLRLSTDTPTNILPSIHVFNSWLFILPFIAAH